MGVSDKGNPLVELLEVPATWPVLKVTVKGLMDDDGSRPSSKCCAENKDKDRTGGALYH